MDMKQITLKDGKEYQIQFDTKDTCFGGIQSFRSSGIKEEEVIDLLKNSNSFIRLSSSGIPEKIISSTIGSIDMVDFSMISSGSGLIVCDKNGISKFSIAVEDDMMFICSLYDTQCL